MNKEEKSEHLDLLRLTGYLSPKQWKEEKAKLKREG